ILHKSRLRIIFQMPGIVFFYKRYAASVFGRVGDLHRIFNVHHLDLLRFGFGLFCFFLTLIVASKCKVNNTKYKKYCQKYDKSFFLFHLSTPYAFLRFIQITNPPIRTTAGTPKINAVLIEPACCTVFNSTDRLFALMERFSTSSKLFITRLRKSLELSRLEKYSVIRELIMLSEAITV